MPRWLGGGDTGPARRALDKLAEVTGPGPTFPPTFASVPRREIARARHHR